MFFGEIFLDVYKISDFVYINNSNVYKNLDFVYIKDVVVYKIGTSVYIFGLDVYKKYKCFKYRIL